MSVNVFNPHTDALHNPEEHAQVLEAIQQLLKHDTGKFLFKYLFRHFRVGDLPPLNMDPEFTHDFIGFARAGKSIFELAAQADSNQAGLILAQIKKEQYSVTKNENTDGQR